MTLIERYSRAVKRRAFRVYCENVGLKRQNDKDFQRVKHCRNVRSNRLLKKVFNALKLYLFRFVRSRRYWTMLQRTLDIWIKRRAIVQWQDRAHQLREAQKRETQNAHSLKFDATNVTLGRLMKDLSERNEINTELRERLELLGKRVLSNCFARYYYIKAARGVNKWKQLVSFQKHRQNLLQSIIHKQMRNNFYRF